MPSISATQTNFHPYITNVNCIVVTTGNLGNLSAKWITDPKQIREILTFVNRQYEGWYQPMLSDTPTGPVVLRFFDGNNSKGFLGIGDNFFSVGQNAFGDDAWCKDASEKQKKEIFSILGPIPTSLKDVILPELNGVTKILVLPNGNLPPTKIITDPEKIRMITEFINEERSGWDHLWDDAPPPVVLELQNTNGCLQIFGIGENCFETLEYNWDWRARHKNASKERVEEILKLAN